MKILNKTDKELKIRVTDRHGHAYSIYLPGGRSTELTPEQVSRDVLKFIESGYLKDISEKPVSKVRIPVNTTENSVTVECACESKGSETLSISKDSNEITQPSDETSENLAHEELKESTSVYLCEFCGCEFASPRGLSMHKSRSHPNEINKEV